MIESENPYEPPRAAETSTSVRITNNELNGTAPSFRHKAGIVILVYLFVIPAMPIYSARGIIIMMGLFAAWAIWYVWPRRPAT